MKCCNNGSIYCHCDLRKIDYRKMIPDGVKIIGMVKFEDDPPPIPIEAMTCGFCDRPCNNEWCCMNTEKNNVT